jgi:hypothetical protein
MVKLDIKLVYETLCLWDKCMRSFLCVGSLFLTIKPTQVILSNKKKQIDIFDCRTSV